MNTKSNRISLVVICLVLLSLIIIIIFGVKNAVCNQLATKTSNFFVFGFFTGLALTIIFWILLKCIIKNNKNGDKAEILVQEFLFSVISLLSLIINGLIILIFSQITIFGINILPVLEALIVIIGWYFISKVYVLLNRKLYDAKHSENVSDYLSISDKKIDYAISLLAPILILPVVNKQGGTGFSIFGSFVINNLVIFLGAYISIDSAFDRTKSVFDDFCRSLRETNRKNKIVLVIVAIILACAFYLDWGTHSSLKSFFIGILVFYATLVVFLWIFLLYNLIRFELKTG